MTVDCPDGLRLSHDSKWTAEALFNLLDNAVKYTPRGGAIRISAEQWEMYVKIDIADTGIGISEQHQGTIFKRFYRSRFSSDVHGIGLGLPLAKSIAEAHGGTISVTSTLGAGTTFTMNFFNLTDE